MQRRPFIEQINTARSNNTFWQQRENARSRIQESRELENTIKQLISSQLPALLQGQIEEEIKKQLPAIVSAIAERLSIEINL